MMVMVYYDLLSLVDDLVGGFGFGGLCLLRDLVGCVSVLISSDALVVCNIVFVVCCACCFFCWLVWFGFLCWGLFGLAAGLRCLFWWVLLFVSG